MKRFISLTLTALLFAVSLSGPKLHAGALARQAYGATQPLQLYDATRGNMVQETFHRGVFWENTGTAFATVLSGTTSATALTLTGQTGVDFSKGGVFYLTLYNSGLTDIGMSMSTTGQAITNGTAYTPQTVIKANTWSGQLGPFSLFTPYAHFYGLTATGKISAVRGALQ